jgi:hypothetical protein
MLGQILVRSVDTSIIEVGIGDEKDATATGIGGGKASAKFVVALERRHGADDASSIFESAKRLFFGFVKFVVLDVSAIGFVGAVDRCECVNAVFRVGDLRTNGLEE